MPGESADDDTRKAEEREPASDTQLKVDQSTASYGKEPASGDGNRIGPYRIVREEGRGGMGSVYLAVRADEQYQKTVAIKVIKRGMDTDEIVQRFRRERQILASLDHPNICRLLDGGATADGQPYFVMEHISGRSLAEYCDSHKLNLVERLKMFRTLCSAVHYAHQNLVIHRDLKPGNILVTADGVPKLLDFGLAKLLNPGAYSDAAPPTAADVLLMTPEYASPEQARGEPITTATDVYSLGVILYELLTGGRPYRFTSRKTQEMIQVITEQEPGKPSTAVTRKSEKDSRSSVKWIDPAKLQKELRGDLDNIILMALRKEPHRRYASAEAFSEDVRRYLEGHPVQARKGTWSYRTGKYIRRHKVSMGAAVAVGLLLAAFAVVTSLQNIRIVRERDLAQREKQRAEAQRQKAEEVTDFLVKLFQTNNPEQAKGETLTARQILDKGTQKIRTELGDQPEVQAKLMDAVGNIYVELGFFDQAKPLLEDALKTRKKILGGQNVSVAESLNSLGNLLRITGQWDEAEKLFREALAICRKESDRSSACNTTNLNLGLVLLVKGHNAEAQSLFMEHLAVTEKQLGIRKPILDPTGSKVISLPDETEKKVQEARKRLVADRKIYGDLHPIIASDLSGLADELRFSRGNEDEAEKLYRQALAIRRKVFGQIHPEVANSLDALALMLELRGQRDEEVEKLYRETLAIRVKLFGSGHPQVADSLDSLSSLLERKGQLDESERLRRQAIAIHRQMPGEVQHFFAAKDLLQLAYLLKQKKDWGEVENAYREAITLFRQIAGSEQSLAETLVKLGEVLVDTQQAKEALPLMEEALTIGKKHLPAGHKDIEIANSILGKCLASLGRIQEAEPLLLQSYERLKAIAPADPETRDALNRIIDFYEGSANKVKAAEYRKLLTATSKS